MTGVTSSQGGGASSTTTGMGGAPVTVGQGGDAAGSGGQTATVTTGTPPACLQAADGSPCSGGTCCGGVCVASFADDPANCGACGRVCGSGSCSGNACVAEVLAESSPTAALAEFASLEQDAGYIYWTDYTLDSGGSAAGANVRRLLKHTTTVSDVIVLNGVNAAYPSGGQLYLPRVQNAIMTCAPSACSQTLTTYASTTSPNGCDQHMAGTSASLFLCAGGMSRPVRCELGTCATLPTTDSPSRVTADATRAFYSMRNEGSIYTTPLTASLATLYAAADVPGAISAAPDGKLYWHEAGTQSIKRGNLAQTPGSIETMNTAIPKVGDLAVSGGWLYWTEDAPGVTTVTACRTSDCSGTATPIMEMSGLPVVEFPKLVLIDDADVYVTTKSVSSEGSHLLRVPRMP